MDPLRHLEAELAALAAAGLLREPGALPHGDLITLHTNDYLGYASTPAQSGQAMVAGAGASRLISGDDPAHTQLEQTITQWLGTAAALAFSSGYAANVGTISALARPGDTILSDASNHASLIDGCRLSGADIHVVPHLDLDAMARGLQASSAATRRWVVTESYFSMAGTSPDLPQLRRLCDEHDAALIVDEAHAIGVFGPQGAGLCRVAGVQPDVLIGTLGKALGLQGAFVTGSRTLRRWLWNRARTFMFSTGLSPLLAHLACERILRAAGDDRARRRLAELSQRVRGELRQADVSLVEPSHGPILFWRVGPPEQAVALSLELRRSGILAPAIRPPTVPVGGAGIRLTLHARLQDAEVERLLACLRAPRLAGFATDTAT